MEVMEQGTFGINCDLIRSLCTKIKEPNLKNTDSDLGLLFETFKSFEPCLYTTNKGHSISVLIVQMVLYIGLCVGVQKK
jgi:hypothetical protein